MTDQTKHIIRQTIVKQISYFKEEPSEMKLLKYALHISPYDVLLSKTRLIKVEQVKIINNRIVLETVMGDIDEHRTRKMIKKCWTLPKAL